MPIRTLGPKVGGFGRDPTSIGERNECDTRTLSPKRTIRVNIEKSLLNSLTFSVIKPLTFVFV